MSSATNSLKGIYGLGISSNHYLDFMNIAALAVFGIIISLFFKENYTKLGKVGPASTTIWGLGLTAIALFLLLFMTIYLTSCNNPDTTNCFIQNKINISNIISHNTLPILLTLLLVIYIIAINFIYFIRINSNNVANSYHTYSLFSIFLLIIQITLIIKYVYNLLNTALLKSDDSKREKSDITIQGVSYILITINFIFVLINHILLAFFSTDG